MSFPALNIEDLFSRPSALSYPFFDDRGQLCWIEAITTESGRLALKQRAPEGERVVTPGNYQIRTRVHEYGGQCFCCVDDGIYFNNFADGLIYRQALHSNTVPVPISAETSVKSAYADFYFSRELSLLLAIQELEGEPGQENASRVVAFDLAKSGRQIPKVLVEGADFYANPRVSPDAGQLAWIQWDHPYMPWDESKLLCADVSTSGKELSLGKPSIVAGGLKQSVCQAGFLANGDLMFALDREAKADSAQNYWNFYRSTLDGVQPLTQARAEFGEAHWVFGQRRWIQLDEQTLLLIKTHNETDQLIEINVESGECLERGGQYARLSQLSCVDGAALGIAEYVDKSAEIVGFAKEGLLDVSKSLDPWIDQTQVSQPEIIKYPTRDGLHAYANYYPAKVLKGSLPALLVLVHGGPTSRSNTALSPLIQYFCQNGFAVLDVNHRGSTGHGRAYRQALLGQWGEIDADDIADAIETILRDKALDAKRVFIRGGSAGGYAVLRALTRFPMLFRGGACYYGIGNLITLAEITHKFEGHYTDQLIAEVYDPNTANNPNSRFTTRSPIFYIDQIKSPLILFQGLDDKVVPPEVSREMVQTLKQNGVQHEYVEYAGEGHGFRQARTKINALRREFQFYQNILSES